MIFPVSRLTFLKQQWKEAEGSKKRGKNTQKNCTKMILMTQNKERDNQAGFRKYRGSRDQIAKIHWIIKKAREYQKNIYFCFIDHAKTIHCVYYKKLWKILKGRGIPNNLTYLLRNLYAGQEATVRTGHGTMAWFQIGKGVRQGCILSPCLFTLYAEYIIEMLNRMKQKLESRLQGEISITSDMQVTPPLWQKGKKN